MPSAGCSGEGARGGSTFTGFVCMTPAQAKTDAHYKPSEGRNWGVVVLTCLTADKELSESSVFSIIPP